LQPPSPSGFERVWTLARETLVIVDHTNDAHAYEYELDPSGGLSLTRYDRDEHGFLQKFESKDTYHVSSHDAAVTRKLLRRLRPEKLEGMGVNVPPQGCPQQQLHASGDFAVAFIEPGREQASHDDRIGIFLSGYNEKCGSLACCTAPAARNAHLIVRKAIQQLVKAAR
jgi:hypothetical protein